MPETLLLNPAPNANLPQTQIVDLEKSMEDRPPEPQTRHSPQPKPDVELDLELDPEPEKQSEPQPDKTPAQGPLTRPRAPSARPCPYAQHPCRT